MIEMCFAPEATHHSHTITDCLAVGQSIEQGADERVILFVKLLEGEALSAELDKRIKSEIRARRSARHVPAKVGGKAEDQRCAATLCERVLTPLRRSFRCKTSPILSTVSA